jgi:hypothetical protein
MLHHPRTHHTVFLLKCNVLLYTSYYRCMKCTLKLLSLKRTLIFVTLFIKRRFFLGGFMKIQRVSFDGFTLKMIAIVAMFIDHAGYLLFDNFLLFRIIGRLTLPIMAFFITEGYRRTTNLKKYMNRLMVFAIISMIPFYLAFQLTPFNILFNLLLGLIVLNITDKLSNNFLRLCVVIFFAYIAYIAGFDGIFTTVPLIYIIHRYRDNFKRMLLYSGCLILGICLYEVIFGILSYGHSFVPSIYTLIRPFMLASFFFIRGYNGKKGRSIRYLFYVFYPAHLLLLYFLCNLFNVL